MTLYALLFTLAAMGLSETAYLYQKRKSGKRPICVVGEETCHIVLESKYKSLIVGIPNDVLGFAFYFAAAVIIALLVIGIGPTQLLDLAIKAMVAAGVLMSLVLTYLQWRVIKVWCFWCLMSAFTIFLMGILAAIGNFTSLL